MCDVRILSLPLEVLSDSPLTLSIRLKLYLMEWRLDGSHRSILLLDMVYQSR